jgi:hypothetical protein
VGSDANETVDPGFYEARDCILLEIQYCRESCSIYLACVCSLAVCLTCLLIVAALKRGILS